MFGGGVYKWHGDVVQDPLKGDPNDRSTSPLLVSMLSGERFFAKRFDADMLELEKYRACILNPIFSDMGQWPCDIIRLEDAQLEHFGLFVRQEYTDVPTPKVRWTGRYALLFPYGMNRRLVSGEARLAGANRELGWKSPAIREMAVQITGAIDRMNIVGYLYADLHFSRLFFGGEWCYLGFSNLVYPISDLENPLTERTRAPARGEYPLEFADPAFARGTIDAIDMRSQNYGLAALLFYLLLGRYPYDGNLTEHMIDDDPISHYDKLEAFLDTPLFVFDPKNHDNWLGDNIRRNRETLALWDELPPDMRFFFTEALSSDSVRRVSLDVPKPRAWMRRFAEHGWTSQSEVS